MTKTPRLRTLPPRLATLDTRTARPPERVRENHDIYGSQRWRTLAAALLKERGRRCQKCGSNVGRLYADHVVELRDGGAPFDPANIEILDARCHGLKTAAARSDRMKAPAR